jgi:opacity protein-like surface antigen
MTFAKTLLAGTALLAILAAPALAAECKEPQTGTNTVPIFSPPIANVVTGTGRLQFYSAPNAACEMKGVFVIPRDKLVAYAQSDDGWSQVMYINPRTGNDVSGWVRSARLKPTGTMGPKQ